MTEQSALMTPEEIEALLASHRDSPLRKGGARITATGHHTATLEFQTNERHLRFGGTVAGPTLMYLADFSMYAALFATYGPKVPAVTTNLNINFLRKAESGLLQAKATILRKGRSLAYGEVNIYRQGEDELVAHATCTYALPK